MDSRINYLENKLEDLRKEKFSLELQAKNTEKEYLNLMDNLSLGSLNKSLNINSSNNNKK